MARHRRMLAAVIAAIGLVAVVPASATASSASREVSEAEVSWWWDDASTVGTSTLVRTDDGVKARLVATGLTPGDAVTLWVITFNNPEACATSPCSIPGDVLNEAAGSDFYWAAGQVVGETGRIVLTGKLDVGQTAYSGKVEVGIGDAVPLDDPYGAEVVLATHSHGPAAKGVEIRHQLKSFTGGCVVFNGAGGFATGFADIPDEVGECATIQRALHD